MAGQFIRRTAVVRELRWQLSVARNLMSQFPDDPRALGMIWACKNLAEAWKLDWAEIAEGERQES